MAGWQCPLRLWYAVHQPELASPPDEAQQATFDMGHRVGELARERYPGGVLVDVEYRDIAGAVERTRELVADSAVPAIYEAAVVHDGALTRVDVLARNGSGWDLIEVKASGSAKEHFAVDVAVQYWILAGAGIDVRHVGLLLLDREYIYPGGEYDLEALFRFEDLTEFCENVRSDISAQVTSLQGVMAQAEPPEIEIGDQCHNPYECPFWAHCSAGLETPEYPLQILPGLRGSRLDGLLKLGIETVPEIPSEYPLTPTQQRVRDATATGQPWISPALRGALEDVTWPLFFLDFEAVGLALPHYRGMRPFDPLPFQFSCHVQAHPDAEVEHIEFLADGDGDPRESLAHSLLQTLGDTGSIIVYSHYEKTTIRNLAGWLPDLTPSLLALEDRLVDLLGIIRAHYYHPDFMGSYSIKNVLPVLVPGMSYEGMDVADGTEAGRVWLQIFETEDPKELARMKRALRDYCRMDSLSMYYLRQQLLAESGSETG